MSNYTNEWRGNRNYYSNSIHNLEVEPTVNKKESCGTFTVTGGVKDYSTSVSKLSKKRIYSTQ